MRKKLSKYIASFDYFDKWLIVLSLTTSSISIASFSVVGSLVGRVSASFSIEFSIFTGIVKNCKLHNIESKIFEALINSEISLEDFMTIINEEKDIEN